MIPVNEPLILEKELEYVSDAIKTGWVSSEGKYLRLFEEKFAEKVGVKHAIAVNNGTSALILAVRALDLPAGSEIIMPSFTIISCALGAIYNDCVPVFVDADPETWCMKIDDIEAKITPQTKAIMPVHLYGHPVQMDELRAIAEKYRLMIIEDFAEAIGTQYKGQQCGGLGHIGAASFYANKAITTGEGGACVTNDDALAAKLRLGRNLAFVPETRFIHYELGNNYRMTNVQAAIGLAQVERFEEQVQKRMDMGRIYTELLQPYAQAGIIQLPVQKEYALNSYWVYGVVLNESMGIDARQCMQALAHAGVATRPFFYPLHLQPALKKYTWYQAEELPVSKWLYDYGFYFPSGLTLTEEQMRAVVMIFGQVITQLTGRVIA